MGLGVGLLGGLILGFIVGRATGGDGTVTITGGSTSGGTLVGADEVEPASVESSREDPVPLGTPVDIGNGWRVEVQSFDAEPELDQAFDAPPGKQFVTAYLVVTYVEGDDEATSPFFGLDISMVGAAGVEYSQSDAACFAPEPEFDNLGDLYVGGVAEGNFCVAVSSADLDELVLVAEPSLSFNDDHKSYFALS